MRMRFANNNIPYYIEVGFLHVSCNFASGVRPTFHICTDLMEFFLKNSDWQDTVSDTGDGYVIERCFLNAYSRHDASIFLGGTISGIFLSKDMTILRIMCTGTAYSRTNVTSEVVHALLHGIISFTTIMSHVYHIHYVCSAWVSNVSNTCLPIPYSICQIIMSTELQTENVISRTECSLLNPNGVLEHIYILLHTLG